MSHFESENRALQCQSPFGQRKPLRNRCISFANFLCLWTLKAVSTGFIFFIATYFATQIMYPSLAQASDLLTKPKHDWSSNGSVDFCPSSKALDFRNAYWLGAISSHSYWSPSIIDQIMVPKAGQKVEVPYSTAVVPSLALGFGSRGTQHFTSSYPLPEAQYSHGNLQIRSSPPLPEEACKKWDMWKCFSNYQNVQSRTWENAECGLDNQWAFYSPQSLSNIIHYVKKDKVLTRDEERQAQLDRAHIEKKVHEYEEKNHVSVNLNWQDVRTNTRCETYPRQPHPDTQSIILENETSVVIAFRGTEKDNSDDLETDYDSAEKVDLTLNKRLWRGAKGSVHRGFLGASEVVLGWLKQKLENIRSRWPLGVNKPIFITGHSLGGAIANLVMYDLLRENKNYREGKSEKAKGRPPTLPYNLQALYTFGSPRVGDKVWAQSMKEMSDESHVGLYRFVNKNDLIPHVPCGGYKHVGTLVHLDELGVQKHILDKEINIDTNIVTNPVGDSSPLSSDKNDKNILRKLNGILKPIASKLNQQIISVLLNPTKKMLHLTSLVYPSFNSCAYSTFGKKLLTFDFETAQTMLKDHSMDSYYLPLSLLRQQLNEALTEIGSEQPSSCHRPPNYHFEGALKMNYQMFDNQIEE